MGYANRSAPQPGNTASELPRIHFAGGFTSHGHDFDRLDDLGRGLSASHLKSDAARGQKVAIKKGIRCL